MRSFSFERLSLSLFISSCSFPLSASFPPHSSHAAWQDAAAAVLNTERKDTAALAAYFAANPPVRINLRVVIAMM